ncbi:unnamed protein product, partial [Ectocarpus sp. 12 AP-2014]
NITPGHGAAVTVSSATLGGSTVLTNNSATQNGGGVVGGYGRRNRVLERCRLQHQPSR